MRASVIIPTYNGAKKIGSTLEALTKQTVRDFETIVVIDGSTDNTLEVVEPFIHCLPELRLIQRPNGGRAVARNTGAAEARTASLIFFDDDVEVPESTVEAYCNLMSQHRVVIGALYTKYKVENEFSHYAAYLAHRWSENLVESGIIKSPYLSANNFFIERELFERVGGFNKNLTDAEDFDLAVRLFEAGEPIYLSIETKVGHTVQETFKAYSLRMIQYRTAQEKLLLENPAVSKYAARLLHVKGIKALIYRFFSFPVYISMMDWGVFRILPRTIRFRLYSVVLTAYPMFYKT